jgi:hypothetical protein
MNFLHRDFSYTNIVLFERTCFLSKNLVLIDDSAWSLWNFIKNFLAWVMVELDEIFDFLQKNLQVFVLARHMR